MKNNLKSLSFILFLLLIWGFTFSLLKKDIKGQIPPLTCMMVIGYSQVGISPRFISGYGEGWYVAPNFGHAFETIVPNGSWQLLWDSGHGVNQWQNPNAAGWTKWRNREFPYFDSACTLNSGTPDRILLSVSGPYGSDEQLWRTNIEAAITTILQQIPSARQLILQAVVGGPTDVNHSIHQTCPCTSACDYGPNVRASWQHAHIDNSIQLVLQDILNGTFNPGIPVIAGYSPHVRTCSDYLDGTGHLAVDGAQAIGASIAQYYSSQVVTPTPTPLGPTPTPTPIPPTSLRINAGGPTFSDSGGNVWSADQAYAVGGFGYVGGQSFSVTNAIANTLDDTLYQTNRNITTGTLEYRFTVPNGTYNVLLKFAEILSTNVAGSRIFDVSVEGNLVADNFDVYVAAGGTFSAVDRTYTSTVNDGILNITFSQVAGRPAVNAIEVIQEVSSPVPTIFPSPTTSPFPTTGNGDTNGDGQVNITDIVIILAAWLQSTTLPLDQYGDGKVNAFDFAVIYRYLTQPPTVATPSPSPAAFTNFITRSRNRLYEGPNPFRFISVNIFNLHVNPDPSWRRTDSYEMEDAFKTVSERGGRVVRVNTLSVTKTEDPPGRLKHIYGPE